MIRRETWHPLHLSLGVSWSFLCFLKGTSVAFPQDQPNILFIVVDDLRPVLGVYGDKLALTPNMDRLGAEGIVFQNAFAQQALCGPSRTSFLTSRRPDTTKLYDFDSYWRYSAGNYTTLPQYFKENGYHTASFGKVFHAGIVSNFTDDMPYSWSQRPFHAPTQVFKDAHVCPSDRDFKRHRFLLCPVDVQGQPGNTLPDIEIKTEAVKFLNTWKEQNKSSPFFLAVGFHKPHIPFKIPREYLRMHDLDKFQPAKYPDFPNGTTPWIAYNTWKSFREREDVQALNLAFPIGRMPDEFKRLIAQYYYASVTYTDHQLGELLRTLESSGLGQNTIISLIGDHGWSLGENGEFAKFSNYIAATRTPWILHDPRPSARLEHWKKPPRTSFPVPAKIVQQPVELLDVFPTLVDMAGLKPVPPCRRDNIHSSILCTEGQSRVRTKGPGWAFTQYPRPSLFPEENSDKPVLEFIQYMGYSIVSHRYRYTEWVSFDNKHFRGNWTQRLASELYRRDQDDFEHFNLASKPRYTGILRAMRKVLRHQFEAQYLALN
eukprot:snap_masked-scaffold770_size100439-processed-gene-0.1 protein:Tk05386 transcript:snap_masked-scaffold770_size100439-processed-gene-0.1-mRNA-1 annotation:"iduronate 2-sulfatase"